MMAIGYYDSFVLFTKKAESRYASLQMDNDCDSLSVKTRFFCVSGYSLFTFPHIYLPI